MWPNVTDLELICEQLLVNKSIAASGAVGLSSTQQSPPPPWWIVWGLGLAFVTVISFSAAIGIFVLPLFKKETYERALCYFVALGVGTLSGSAIFHLLPESFGIGLGQSGGQSNGGQHEYIYKACMVLFGIYLFFLVDRFLKFVGEIKTRKLQGKIGDVSDDGKTTRSADVHATRKDVEHGHLDMKERSNEKEQQPAEQRKQGKSHHIAPVAYMVVFGDGLHNFIDGLSIGAAFTSSILAGLSVSVAVLCEEVPHEFGDVAILLNSGMTLRQALFYNLASAFTCYVGFVFGVLLGDLDERIARMIFALAGGMFLYISLSAMLTEMNSRSEEDSKKSLKAGLLTTLLQIAGIASGLALMFLLGRYGDEIRF